MPPRIRRWPDLPQTWEHTLEQAEYITGMVSHALQDSSNLGPAQYQILAQLDGGERTLSELSDALGCTRGNITGLTERLRALGLIERTRHPEDARSYLVRLTIEGRARLQRAREGLKALTGTGNGFDSTRQPAVPADISEAVTPTPPEPTAVAAPESPAPTAPAPAAGADTATTKPAAAPPAPSPSSPAEPRSQKDAGDAGGMGNAEGVGDAEGAADPRPPVVVSALSSVPAGGERYVVISANRSPAKGPAAGRDDGLF